VWPVTSVGPLSLKGYAQPIPAFALQPSPP